MGPAIPALVNLLAHVVVVLSSSNLVDGFLEAIWRWSLTPTSQLLLSIDSSQQGPAMLPLSCVKLAVLRFGPHPARMSPHGVMQEWVSSWRTPFATHTFYFFFQGVFFSIWACDESCSTLGQWRYRSPPRHLWISRG